MDIGSLGLDTKDVEAALDRIGQKLGRTAAQAEGLNMAVTAAAAAIAIWAKNIIDAKEKADQLDKAIDAVAKSLGAPEFNTESGLETRLKEVDSLLEKLQAKTPLHQVVIQKVGDFFTGKNRDAEEDAAGTMAIEKRKEIEGQLAMKIAEQTKLLQLKRFEMKEEAEILEAQIKYDEMRVKLAGSLTAARQEALKLQKEELITGIRQKYAEERAAEEQKQRKEAEEKAAKDAAKWISDTMKENDAKAKDALDAEKKLTDETLDEYEKIQKERNAANKADRERLALNQKVTEELKAQTREMAAARSGNATAAKREAMENRYEKEINEANRTGNTEGVKQLEKQRQIERDDLDIEESKKSPSQRRAERKAGRDRESDRKKAEARNAELERRAKRGATSAQIEGREGVENDQGARAGRVERERQKGITPPGKGFDETAAKNLQDIANVFRSKGKTP